MSVLYFLHGYYCHPYLAITEGTEDLVTKVKDVTLAATANTLAQNNFTQSHEARRIIKTLCGKYSCSCLCCSLPVTITSGNFPPEYFPTLLYQTLDVLMDTFLSIPTSNSATHPKFQESVYPRCQIDPSQPPCAQSQGYFLINYLSPSSQHIRYVPFFLTTYVQQVLQPLYWCVRTKFSSYYCFPKGSWSQALV